MGDACGHHHSGERPAPDWIAAQLAEAEARCAVQGERLTDARRRVLTLLLQAGEPVKAYDLIAAFGEDGRAAKPPTVYRALDFLEKQGFAHRIASISAYVACAGGADDHAAAFLICDCCGAAEEVSAPNAALLKAAREAGYAIERATVEAHGRCAACRVAA